MKRQFLLLFAIAVFTATLTTNASGQTSKTLRANVKFDFQIGDRIYPAGEYRIESISQSDNLMRIRNVADPDKTEIILANHPNATKKRTPRLVFLKDGQRYFLTEIFLDSGEWGYSFTPSHAQRASKSNLASRLPRKN